MPPEPPAGPFSPDVCPPAKRLAHATELVVLSPHLDDAALSLGGTLLRAAHAPAHAQVWTFYTAGPPVGELPPKQRVFGDYAARAVEDVRALAILEAEPRHLGLWERIWREPQVRGLHKVFRAPDGLGGFSELPRVRRIVETLLVDRPDATVLAPLGIGGHVDHLELAIAALQAATAAGALHRVGFYEDFYAISEHLRRRHPVTRRARRRPFAAPGWAAPLAGATVRAAAQVPRGPSLDALVDGFSALEWECVPTLIAAEEHRKLAAVAAYESQTELLGRLAPGLPLMLRRQHAVRGGEPVWWASAPHAEHSTRPSAGRAAQMSGATR